MNRSTHLAWAEVIDGYRIIPRLFMATCFAWCVHTAYVLLYWYMALPANERGTQESSFAFGVFSAIVSFLTLVFKTYSANGRDWTGTTSQSLSGSTQ